MIFKNYEQNFVDNMSTCLYFLVVAFGIEICFNKGLEKNLEREHGNRKHETCRPLGHCGRTL